MIFGDDGNDKNSDTRDLIFATQSLVRYVKTKEEEEEETQEKYLPRTKATDKEKLSSMKNNKLVQHLISAGSFVKSVNLNRNAENEKNSFNYPPMKYDDITSKDNDDNDKWVLQTRLFKRKVKKDLRNVKSVL